MSDVFQQRWDNTTEEQRAEIGNKISQSKKGIATGSISFETKGKEQVNGLIEKLRQVESVIDIERTTG